MAVASIPRASPYTHLRGVLLTLPWAVHLLLADLGLSALLPVSSIAPKWTYAASSLLAYSVWKAIQNIFVRSNGARISTSGANLPSHESAIVVANHLGWTDFYMIQQLAIRAGMLGHSRWFAKQELKKVPFLGWGLWAMGMPLVSRNWVQDKREIDRVFGKIVDHQLPVWLISYSEATRYTRKKYAEAVEWCKANGKPVPRHTLYPRTRGFIATVKKLRETSHVKAVYDVTIAYAKGDQFLTVPSMWDTMSIPHLSPHWKFHVHVERYPLEDLPHTDEKLAQWLEDRWMDKSDKLEALKHALQQGISWDTL